MKIYIYGCICGVNGVLVNRVKRSHPDTQVINTKYEEQGRAEHVELLRRADMETDSYPAIVVDGTTITRLESWTS